MGKVVNKLAVFGGTFDPLHFGHINMAISLLEIHKLDSVLFCPVYASPFKAAHPPVASPAHRLAMVASAIENIEPFALLDWEMQKASPSYTIDTISRLKSETNADLFLLLGEDQLAALHQWKDVEQLFSLCAPLIASRDSERVLSHAHFSDRIQALISRGCTKIPMMEISSTDLRERLRQGRFCGHLIPHPVLDYIARHRLYG